MREAHHSAKAQTPNAAASPTKDEMPRERCDAAPVKGVMEEPLGLLYPEGGAPVGAAPYRLLGFGYGAGAALPAAGDDPPAAGGWLPGDWLSGDSLPGDWLSGDSLPGEPSAG